MRTFCALHSCSVRAAATQRRLRSIVVGLAFGAALLGGGQGHAETWVDVPGAEGCRVDTDSTAYDAQADVVAFRYVCTGADASAIAVACTGNESWRAEGAASPGASFPGASYIDWLMEFLRSPARIAPPSGRYTAPAPIERGTPIGRARNLVCDSKDRYKQFKFTGVR